MTDSVREWLDACPKPVVARVINSWHDLSNLIATESVYEDNILVVIDLKELGRDANDYI